MYVQDVLKSGALQQHDVRNLNCTLVSSLDASGEAKPLVDSLYLCMCVNVYVCMHACVCMYTYMHARFVPAVQSFPMCV